MERLGALDAEFLHLEDGVTHLHIGSCAVFEGPPPAHQDLVALTEAKLDGVPRYRKRVRFVPFQLGRPVWADDPDFDITHHMHHVKLPAPGDEAQLRRLVGELMSYPLDRERPLWDHWQIDGLGDGRWGLLSKVHHAMVDGVAGTDLMAALLDLEPDVPSPEPEASAWTPEADPSTGPLLIGAAKHLVETVADQVRSVPGMVRRPGEVASRAVDVGRGLLNLGSTLRAAPDCSIEGPIGPNRRWSWVSAPLDDAKAIRKAHGGTVNDVVLAVIAGGFRALLASRGEDPDGLVLRTLVPVSVRSERGVLDNQVSGMVAELPVAIADPLERLAAVRAETDRLKGSHEAEAGETMVNLGALTPPVLLAVLSRAAVRLVERRPQSSVNTVTTNVPGPQFPLYACGRRMVEFLPFVPIAPGVRIGVAILSYNGRLTFGVTGDYDTTPDIDVLCDGIDTGFAELRKLS